MHHLSQRRISNGTATTNQMRDKAFADLSLGTWLQLRALDITESTAFTVVTTGLIVLNAVVIGAQTEHMANTRSSVTPYAYKIIELVFCLAFSGELAIRLSAYKYDFFGDEWKWNIFDTLLVFSQICELVIDFSVGSTGPNVSFMRILRVLRLVRVMRLVRVIRYISELRTIIASVANSLRSLFFTIVLIAFIIYIIAIFFTQLVTEYLQSSDDEVAAEELREYFTSVPDSCLVLFQTMTNGVDWRQVVVPLTDHISPALAVVYSIYVAFTMFAMLNVITGVFVESALASDAEEKDAALVSQLLDFLAHTGLARPGVLTWDEFQERLRDPAMHMYFKSVDLDSGEALSLFKLMDADENGEVEAEEFVLGCLRLRGNAKAIDLATLMYENRRAFGRIEAHLRSIRTRQRYRPPQLPEGKPEMMRPDSSGYHDSGDGEALDFELPGNV
jgi:voltage-gated sodium channel